LFVALNEERNYWRIFLERQSSYQESRVLIAIFEIRFARYVRELLGALRAGLDDTALASAGKPAPDRHHLPGPGVFLAAVIPVHRRVDHQRSFHGSYRGDHVQGEGASGASSR